MHSFSCQLVAHVVLALPSPRFMLYTPSPYVSSCPFCFLRKDPIPPYQTHQIPLKCQRLRLAPTSHFLSSFPQADPYRQEDPEAMRTQ